MGTLDAALQQATAGSDQSQAQTEAPQQSSSTLSAALRAATGSASAAPSGALASPSAPSKAIAMPEGPKSAGTSLLNAPLDVATGLGETALRGALGTVAQAAGGVTGWLETAAAKGWLPKGIGVDEGDWDKAQAWTDKVTNDVATLGGKYLEPHSATGKAIQGAMDWALGWLPKAASGAGGAVAGATGSPLAGAVTDAAVQALPQIAGAKLLQRTGRIAPSEGAPAPGVPAPALAPESIVKAPAAPGQAVVGGGSAPELADAMQKMPPTVEAPPAPMQEASDHVAGTLPPQEQAAREALLARTGHQNARRSAVEGNGPQTASDYDAAKAPTMPDGSPNPMRAQIDSETAANAAFADKIRQQTGGTSGLDQTSLSNRGNVIDAARAGLQEWHENNVKSLYQTARDNLGDTPVSIPSVIKAADDPLAVGGTVEGATLRTQLQSILKKLGMVDDEGNAQPITVNQAEGLRQWLGDSWTPRTSRFITALKAGLDDDVTSAAGQDVFQQARAARVAQAGALENPMFNKIAALSDAQNFEAIPDAVARMPAQQLAHVTNVLQNMPEGLQSLGTQALQEIAGHFANRMAEAGTPRAVGGAWGDIGVSKYIANNNARMAQVFTPQGMQMISDLNQVGKVTAMDKRYLGAAAQGMNLAQHGLVYALPKIGAAAGGFTGSLFGTPGTIGGSAVGSALAQTAASKLEQAFARRKMAERIKPLRPSAVTPANP